MPSVENITYKYAAFELDAYAKKAGIIKRYKNLDVMLKYKELAFYEQFKEIGDYIQGPGMNPETAIVFYFKTKSSEEQKRLANQVWEQFEIVT